MKRKKILFLLLALCLTAAGCRQKEDVNTETFSSHYYSLRYIGQFADKFSLLKTDESTLQLEKEQGDSFEVYSVNMDSGELRFAYAIPPQGNLLYANQINKEQLLTVRQLGNGEENNILRLEGEKKKDIAVQIAYSDRAVVSVSPSGRYVIFCRAEDLPNSYSLYAYDLQLEKLLPLLNSVGDELLNDLEHQLNWSKDEKYLLVSNRYVLDMGKGSQRGEIQGAFAAWSENSGLLAYAKKDSKSLCIVNMETFKTEEVFVANSGESLTNFLVWSKNGAKLAFLTAANSSKGLAEGIRPFTGIYSLNLKNKEAKRVDQALDLGADFVARTDSLYFNASGSLLAVTFATYTGNELFIYQTDTGEYDFFMNVEYLHAENGENYVCNLGNKLYFLRMDKIIEMDENLSSRSLYKSERPLEDIYTAADTNSILLVERWEKGTSLRRLQLRNE